MIQLKQKDKLWTLQVTETFTFDLDDLINIKVKFGNFKQLDHEQRLENYKETRGNMGERILLINGVKVKANVPKGMICKKCDCILEWNKVHICQTKKN